MKVQKVNLSYSIINNLIPQFIRISWEEKSVKRFN